jgi:hypothetical protein
VTLYEIRADDRGVPVSGISLKHVRHVPGRGLIFASDKSELQLSLPVKEQLSFLFATNSRSGTVNINIDGEETTVDLYRTNWAVQSTLKRFWLLDSNGKFKVSFNTPRYDVETLRIKGKGIEKYESIYLKTGNDLTELPFTVNESAEVIINNPFTGLKHYFSVTHFPIQAIFAAICTLLIMSGFSFIKKSGGIRGALIEEKRWFFWLTSVGAVSVYSIWLVAFWPGVMSVDSLNIWRAALLPDVVINNHPIINEIFYMFLQQVWKNPGIVPLAQITVLSAMIGVVFYQVYESGVQLKYLVPCYLFLLLSVPVGLYNIAFWKDVPFAILVVFWGLVPIWMYVKKKKQGVVKLSWRQIVFLLSTFIGLLFFRYNGMVYLFVVPLVLTVIGVVNISKRFVLSGCLAGVLLLGYLFSPISLFNTANFFNDLTRTHLERLKDGSIVKQVSTSIRNYPRILDIKNNPDQSDFWHYYLDDRFNFGFLEDAGWNDVYSYQDKDHQVFGQLRDTAMRVYKGSLQYPWYYLSWYVFPFTYLMPLAVLFYRKFPLSAIFSVIILSQTFALLFFVGTTNWRYYYFMLLGGYFLLPVMLMDVCVKKNLYQSVDDTKCVSLS